MVREMLSVCILRVLTGVCMCGTQTQRDGEYYHPLRKLPQSLPSRAASASPEVVTILTLSMIGWLGLVFSSCKWNYMIQTQQTVFGVHACCCR